MSSRMLMFAVAVAAPLSHAVAQTAPPPITSSDEARAAARLPSSADDHAAMAKSYELKAGEWRKEAVFHREMAAAYAAAHADPKGGARNAEAKKMEKHCMAIVGDAERLAADADWSARYHRERAKELGGAGR